MIWANLLRASTPWENRNNAFLVADTQKSSSSCLAVFQGPDSFERDNGSTNLRFHYTEEDAERNLRAYLTTLLGALRCRTDVQVADGRGMLLKYVSSYVTKMHESVTSEGLYCSDMTGYQAANSFLRTVRPLAPEMVFQLSSFKAAWTDKLTRQFTPPHPGQENDNLVYKLYLSREATEEDLSLLQWLRCHTVVGKKAKALGSDKFLVAVKFVSVHNPVFFFKHLVVHYAHHSPSQLRHLKEASMPAAVQFFAQAVTLCPNSWTTSQQILHQFEFEGHRSSYLTTVVAFVQALHDILFLWQRCVVDGRIGSLQARSIERLYPLSAFQTAIYRDIVDSLAQRQRFLNQPAGNASSRSSSSSTSAASCSWSKYCVLLGKPGTGKSQVLIRAIHTAL